jgi:uncharacterized protein YciI
MHALKLAAIVLAAGSASALAQSAAPSPAPAPAAKPAAPVMKTWFLRLVPPRTTFPADMTPAEEKLMDEHFLYWKDLFQKGVCIFGGPVFDPKGAFGVVVVRAATMEEARALADGDPTVKAGMNKMEVAPMIVSFLPGAK